MIKYKTNNKTILNFSAGKISKNKLRKALSTAKFIPSIYNDSGIHISYVDNEIIIGMYKIRILFNWNKEGLFLRNYGGFQIRIYQGDDNQEIDLNQDLRFKSEIWNYSNNRFKLKIKHLTEIIIHCQKLNNLKAFL